MSRKSEFLTLRLTPTDQAAVTQICQLTGCNKSEAVRRLLRAARFAPISVTETQTQNDAGLVRQDKAASVVLEPSLCP